MCVCGFCVLCVLCVRAHGLEMFPDWDGESGCCRVFARQRRSAQNGILKEVDVVRSGGATLPVCPFFVAV